MPIYTFECTKCRHRDDEYQKMGSDPVQTCPECEDFTYTRQVSLSSTDLKEFHTPIEMHSIATSTPEEISQLRQDCPDLEISDNPNDDLYGVPIARNRKQKLAALKSVGYMERN